MIPLDIISKTTLMQAKFMFYSIFSITSFYIGNHPYSTVSAVFDF